MKIRLKIQLIKKLCNIIFYYNYEIITWSYKTLKTKHVHFYNYYIVVYYSIIHKNLYRFFKGTRQQKYIFTIFVL